VEIGEVLKCRSKSGFVSMDAAHVILATTPSVMDGHRMGSVKDVSLCTSFTFTPRSPKEELKTQASSWFEFPRIVKNANPMCGNALKLELNHELSANNSAFSFGPPGRDAWCPCLAGTDE
jgi:hypothetical protein